MIIGIRKESNGSLYIDKNIYTAVETLKLTPDAFERFKKEHVDTLYTSKEVQEQEESYEIYYNSQTMQEETRPCTNLVNYVLVTKRVATDEELAQLPYLFTKIQLDDKYSDCMGVDFNDDLTFNVDKYNARKQKENKLKYKKEVERLISLRYDVRDELAIQRQKNEKPEEYKEYYDYVEQCKAKVKAEMNNSNLLA